MPEHPLRKCIEHGDIVGLIRALESNPDSPNIPIHWHLNQNNVSDPLHYVSDCVSNGWLNTGLEGEIADRLLKYGAALEGREGRETPLLGSTSLGVPKVSEILIQSGANLKATSMFNATALHWAAWMGNADTVDLLITKGAQIEAKDSEFGVTPLYWAVHGFGPSGPRIKKDQVKAAKTLLLAGASLNVSNHSGISLIELALSFSQQDMHELLSEKR